MFSMDLYSPGCGSAAVVTLSGELDVADAATVGAGLAAAAAGTRCSSSTWQAWTSSTPAEWPPWPARTHAEPSRTRRRPLAQASNRQHDPGRAPLRDLGEPRPVNPVAAGQVCRPEPAYPLSAAAARRPV
jgi:hypothetical protein